MSVKRIVIWDWNGTLLDDVDAAVNALNRMLLKHGLPPTNRDYYRKHFGFPVRPFYRELGIDFSKYDWDSICEDFHVFIAEEKQCPRPEAKSALLAIRASGVFQGILSALREDILVRDTSKAGLDCYLDFRFGVDNLDGASKLSRGYELMRYLSATYGTFEAVFVGDTLHDVEVAHALGCHCVLVNIGHQSAERFVDVKVPVVGSLMDAVTKALEFFH